MTVDKYPAVSSPEAGPDAFGPREGFNGEELTEFDPAIIQSEPGERSPAASGIDIITRNTAGVAVLGYYNGYPVVRFLYHKSDASGELEEVPRTVVVTAIYEGEHSDHTGQGNDAYLHGPQINDPSDASGEALITGAVDGKVKNFSIQCITAPGKFVVDARTGERTYFPPEE